MARVLLVTPEGHPFDKLHKWVGHRRVFRLGSATEALRWLKPGRCELLIVASELPGIHGLELVRMLRRQGGLAQATPVLVCSNLTSSLNIRRAIGHGASGFISLADCPELLSRVIDALLQGALIFPEYSSSLSESDARWQKALEFSTEHVAVLHGLCEGTSPASLAMLLQTTGARVNLCKRQMMRKLEVASFEDLIAICREIGLIP
ncbi:response regulator [Pseudomonas sp. CAN2814]|uniref:response regulator n=1 Tax=Pseudomonas sp. CAN1 TaxID=3046726 RepID=UPI002648FA52|nr:response regulator [Pseudomonas sp. CAN1]MDN6859909.1 response regulator [Pseudomonas sp. CAN1]